MSGVLVGADISQEWLLPWWWEKYKKHNDFPVAFFDFGMSAESKRWCRERGQLIPLSMPAIFVKDKEEVQALISEHWEEHYGENFWQSRLAWFKKPLACSRTPFYNSIWLDLDCEVLRPLLPLFTLCRDSSKIALVKDQLAPVSTYPIYNSGVIVFRKDNPLIRQWAEQALAQNDLFRGDQDLLSHLVNEGGFPVEELPYIYNWNIGCGNNPEAAICHWVGERAKAALRDQLILLKLQSC